MNEWEIEDLAEDIRKNGLLEPIILFENEILDGRNRYLACKKANIEPTFRIFNFNIDPYDFVISENLKRRHLNSAQLTEVGFKMWPYERERAKERQDRTLPDLGEKGTKPISNVVPSELTTLENQLEGKSRDLVAKKLHISGKTLQQAKKITEVSEEDPEIAKKLDAASLTMKRKQFLKLKNKKTPIGVNFFLCLFYLFLCLLCHLYFMVISMVDWFGTIIFDKKVRLTEPFIPIYVDNILI